MAAGTSVRRQVEAIEETGIDKLLTTRVLALAMTGFTLGAAVPAQAAMLMHGGPRIELSAMHNHHRHKVCHIEWRHHHPMKVCHWHWSRW